MYPNYTTDHYNYFPKDAEKIGTELLYLVYKLEASCTCQSLHPLAGKRAESVD